MSFGAQKSVKAAFIGALLLSFSFAQTYDLPIFFVDTKNKCLDKYVTEKIPATLKVLDGKTNAVADSAKGTPYDIGINIGEGYSALFPKPNYGIEIRDEKGGAKSESLLGYPPSSDWFLRGPYIDKSLLRESFAQWLFRQAGRYSPRTKHFDLFINGVYRGVYVLTEEIYRDKYRVNIEEIKDTDISGENLTGGYIWKFNPLSSGSIETVGFNTSDGLSVILNTPNKQDIQKQQEDYLKKYINDLEGLFKNGKDGTGYDSYVDVSSMIDYVLHEELTDNTDSYVYNVFLYKSRGGKALLGPLWQYDLAMSNGSQYSPGFSSSITGWQIENSNKTNAGMGYYGAMAPVWLLKAWKKADFQNELKDRWAELRSGVWHTKTIDAYLDSMKTYLKNAADRNFKRWPNLGKNSGQYDPDPEPMKYCNQSGGGSGVSQVSGGYNATTWDGEVEHVRKKVKERMTWIDQELGFLASANPVVTAPVDPTIHEPDWHEKPAEEIVVTPREHKNSPNSKGFTELKSPTQPQGIHQEGFGRLSPTNYFVVNGNHLEIYTDLGGTFALIDLNGSVLFKTRIETGVTSLKIPATAKDKRWIATLNGKMLNK